VPKVLVVDDEEMLVNLLRRQLQTEGYEVFTAMDGLSALRLARRHQPDLILLDIAMPGTDGLEVCKRLRQDPALRDIMILFLTCRDDVSDRVEGLETGADDYLPKPFNTEELLARVRALLRRSSVDAPEDEAEERLLRVGPLELDPARCVVRIDGKTSELPPVQFDLLYHFMSHPNEVFAAEQLLVQVWGYVPGTGDTSLVRWHVKKLRNQIEPDPSNPRILCTVPRQGYVLTGPED